MSPDRPPSGSASPPQEAVVEFGPDRQEKSGPERRRRRRRRSFTALMAALAADRRSVPLATAVGAVALFASLLSEWQITVIDTTEFGSASARQPVTAGVGDLGAFGAGYLAGLFALAAAMVLVLFGPPAVRPHARLLGLSTGGVLLGLISAISADLGDVSRGIDRLVTLQLDATDIELTYGRGIWCAVFGVAALTVALYLAGRQTPVAVGKDDTEDDTERAGTEDVPVLWSWRGPPRPEEEERVPEPFDLSVSSTSPFASLSDDRNKPVKRD